MQRVRCCRAFALTVHEKCSNTRCESRAINSLSYIYISTPIERTRTRKQPLLLRHFRTWGVDDSRHSTDSFILCSYYDYYYYYLCANVIRVRDIIVPRTYDIFRSTHRVHSKSNAVAWQEGSSRGPNNTSILGAFNNSS